MSTDHPARAMVLGHTKAGRSSFINYLVQKNVAPTDPNSPTTQNFAQYNYTFNNGIALQIWDGIGLDETLPPAAHDIIIDFLQKNGTVSDFRNWFHFIFYCVNGESERLKPYEVAFLSKLCQNVPQTVHIIMTHCRDDAHGRAVSTAMAETIRDQLPGLRILIHPINSVTAQTRLGTFAPFGRSELLAQMFDPLWSDISRYIADGYSKVLRQAMHKMCDEMEATLALIQADADAHDAHIQVFLQKHQAIIDEANATYHLMIQPILDLYNDTALIGRAATIAQLDAAALTTQFFDLDLGESPQQAQKLTALTQEIGSLPPKKTIAEKIKTIGLSLQTHTLGKQLQAKTVEFSPERIRQAIPAPEQIAATLYDHLWQSYQQI